jgi:hypothetical protein
MRVAQSLRHVNIVQFLGAALAGDQIMLVTEYMPRGDLWRALSQDSAAHFGWRSACARALCLCPSPLLSAATCRVSASFLKPMLLLQSMAQAALIGNLDSLRHGKP